MARLPEGYKVAVLDPHGTVVDVIEIDGDLSHPVVRMELATDVERAVHLGEAAYGKEWP